MDVADYDIDVQEVVATIFYVEQHGVQGNPLLGVATSPDYTIGVMDYIDKEKLLYMSMIGGFGK